MSAVPKIILSEEAYLTQERKATVKSEFYKGEIFAMSGASKEHNKITAAIIGNLYNHLVGKVCIVMPSDMRVYNPANSLYTYPDVVVACGEEKYLDDEFDTLLNPTIIVEVLSESTKDYDRGTKFQLYRSIPSLQHYLLVNSLVAGAELYTRDGNNWVLTTASLPDDSLYMAAIQYQFVLKDFYLQVPALL